MNNEIRYRDAQLTLRDAAKGEIELSFASEEPVQRFFGWEILDLRSADLSRLNNGGPLLVGHNPDDQVGAITRAWVAGDKARATARFSRSARAQEILGDVQDGIRTNVSVGYRINKTLAEKTRPDGSKEFRFSWTALEVSLVSVPADASVGVGRSSNMENQSIGAEVRATFQQNREAELAEAQKITEGIARQVPDRAPAVRAAFSLFREGAGSLNQFREQVMTLVSNREQPVASAPFRDGASGGPIGMSQRDLSQYSLVRAIRTAAEGKRSGLEFEVSDEYVKQSRITPQGQFVIPPDVLQSPGWGKRDNIVATASLGGNLVATNLLAGSFIDILRNRLVLTRMGATMLDGLVGNVVIPRQSATQAFGWVAETTASSELSITFQQITLTPKTLTGFVDYNKQLLVQSTPGIDQIVRNDIVNGIAVALESAALHGGGAPAPTGLAGVSGIGAVTAGTDGATISWANIVNLEKEVAIDNADMGNLGYVTNSRVLATMKQQPKQSGGVEGSFIIGDDVVFSNGIARLNNFTLGISNNVASNLTKGTSTTVCSAIFFGDWSSMLIGMWGGLDILVDPYSQSSARVVRVVATQYSDINVRHPESFAALLDALT